MKRWEKVPETIDEYIAAFPSDVQQRLKSMRKTIAKAAPEATEAISYQIPTFKLAGNLVHFAGYKNHIGFYPGAAALVKFAPELAGFKTAKGTVQFAHSQPIPLDLVATIVRFRVQANVENAHLKKNKEK